MSLDRQPTLHGRLVGVRPLEPGDLEALYAVARDPLIWELHPTPDRWRRPVFESYFAEAIDSRGAVLVTAADCAVIGASRFHEYAPGLPRVEIGWTFLARDRWGGAHSAELKQLMLDHAFGSVDAVRFRVGAGNLRSRRAVEKLGARLLGPSTDLEGHVEYALQRDDWRARPGACDMPAPGT